MVKNTIANANLTKLTNILRYFFGLIKKKKNKKDEYGFLMISFQTVHMFISKLSKKNVNMIE